MNLSTVKWAQWDKTQSRELLVLFICVCIALCTIVAHNIAQNRPDNFPSYPLDDHHCSDDVYLREGGKRDGSQQKIVPCGTDGQLLLSGLQAVVTLTLTLGRVIRHTVKHQSSTSIHTPNFIEIGKTSLWTDRQTYVYVGLRTDGHFRPPLMLLGKLGVVDIMKRFSVQWTSCLHCCDTVGWASVEAFGQEKTEWWGAGMVIYLQQGANHFHMVQLMPLPPRHLLLQ